MDKILNFLNHKLFAGTDFEFPLINVVYSLLILITAWIILWVITHVLLARYYRRKKIAEGGQYAINQILKYFVYVIAILTAVQALGIQLTVLWGGAAALVVGIGLGLQQTFNDFASGIILLFDRSIEVGDVVQFGSTMGRVDKIGMRTSKVWSRNNVMLIIPNSKMVIDSVINWSHNGGKARFSVGVGVAYGSDTEKVASILLEVAGHHPKILKDRQSFVRFLDFADSALLFEVFFWSEELLGIEDVKSDIRFMIDQKFREQNVAIPFPQRDIWVRSDQKPGG